MLPNTRNALRVGFYCQMCEREITESNIVLIVSIHLSNINPLHNSRSDESSLPPKPVSNSSGSATVRPRRRLFRFNESQSVSLPLNISIQVKCFQDLCSASYLTVFSLYLAIKGLRCPFERTSLLSWFGFFRIYYGKFTACQLH